MHGIRNVAGRADSRVHGVLLVAMALIISAGCGSRIDNPAAPSETVTLTPDSPTATLAPSVVLKAKRPATVDLCHRADVHDGGGFLLITVPDASVVPHLQHGDGRVGDPIPGHPGMLFDVECSPITTCTAPPGAPGFLGWTTAGLPSGTVRFSWEPGSGTISSYIVELGTTIGGTDVAVTDTGSTSTSYSVSGLTPSVDYYHARVRSKNACGLSGPSNEANPRIE